MKLSLLMVVTILASAHAQDQSIDLAWSDAGLTFNLYTRDNPTSSQVIEDSETLESSNFLNTRQTYIITHGWLGSAQESAITAIRDAYITTGDYNIFTVHWTSIWKILTAPINSVKNNGAIIAEFLDFLQEVGDLNPATTQLIGHSLGAHIMSYAARVANGTYGAVIGLDPAGSNFEEEAEAINIGIQSGDATKVVVIHTNGGGMAISRAAGDIDYFINGGSSQPGCILDMFGICSHFRACSYFAESIRNPTGFPTEEDTEVFMGGAVLSTKARGNYTAYTASASPYALE